MSDDRPPMPPQPKTKEIPKVEIQTSQFSELKAIMLEGFAKVDGAIFDLGERVIRVEIRQKDLEERMGRNSTRVRGTSENDMRQDAAIAQVIQRQDAHEKALATVDGKVDSLTTKTDAQTAMLTKLTNGASRLAANPIVRSIATMLGTAILTWLAAHGGAK